MRVVVTGGSGTAGQEVVRAVAAAGHEVFNLDLRPPAPGIDLPAEFCRVQITEIGELYDAMFQFRPEMVCHLAANPAPQGQARVDVFTNNTLTHYNMLQVAGDLGVKRVVYASSETVTGIIHGRRPQSIPFNESQRMDAPNSYALSKYLTEVIADYAVQMFPDTSFVGLRLSNVMPNNAHGREMLAERRSNLARGAFNLWSYVDARDVGSAFLAAMNGDTRGNEVFLVAAADTVVDVPLKDLIAEHFPGEGLENLVPDSHGPTQSAFDCSKMERVFGWTPKYSWRDDMTV
ncbi:MAG TPA: NAD(P)-dependent oxidoreductase [Thermomicrobiales bacterium]|jgi:nucleoside-diphosphate-sugar epimerase|nr:NAD(P)-dependent oxidoreductase [Thermomicrobiales bacterium]